MRIVFALLVMLTCASIIFAQPKNDAWLKQLFYRNASDSLKYILDRPDTFQYQLIYTRIDRDKKGKAHCKNYYLNVGRHRYFNPASTVKMPLAFLALEKMNSLAKYGVTMSSEMLTDSNYTGQTKVLTDTTSENKMPSVAQYIRKVFLVSDNDAYNRLYELSGQEEINKSLWKKGYKDIRITRRFVPMNEEENRHTNAIDFFSNGKLLYHQPEANSKIEFQFPSSILIGNAHYDRNDSLVNTPMDFTRHNNLPLEDLQHLLQSVIFPQSVAKKQRFAIPDSSRQFLLQYMSELPGESSFPKYDTTEYFDAYTKFFWFKAGKQKLPSYIRSFNKPGWSYGFLTDAAYIVDFQHNVEFMLSAVIYVNKDGILNDDKYEYEETGYPFFRETGEIIYKDELQRKRKYPPDLSEFKLDYK